MKRIVLILSWMIGCATLGVAQTLEECQQAAERNYPLIRQFDLIEKTTEMTLANIQKGWLPQVSATAQAALSPLPSADGTWTESLPQKRYQSPSDDE